MTDDELRQKVRENSRTLAVWTTALCGAFWAAMLVVNLLWVPGWQIPLTWALLVTFAALFFWVASGAMDGWRMWSVLPGKAFDRREELAFLLFASIWMSKEHWSEERAFWPNLGMVLAGAGLLFFGLIALFVGWGALRRWWAGLRNP